MACSVGHVRRGGSMSGKPSPSGVVSRRRALQLTGLAVVTGLAGCSMSDGSPSSSDTNSPPTDDGAGGGTTTDRAASATPTPDLVQRADFDCTAMGDSMVRDESTGRPFVATFDRPEGWIRTRTDTATHHVVRVSAPVTNDQGNYLYRVDVKQFFEPVTEDAQHVDELTEVGILQFGNETRTIYEHDAGDMGRSIFSVIVPGARDEYHRIEVDCFTLAFDEPECFDAFRNLGLTMIGSLLPRE